MYKTCMRELKTCLHRSPHMNDHSNIIIAKTWKKKKTKNIKCPPTDEWIYKMAFIYTIECILFGNKVEMKYWYKLQHV